MYASFKLPTLLTFYDKLHRVKHKAHTNHKAHNTKDRTQKQTQTTKHTMTPFSNTTLPPSLPTSLNLDSCPTLGPSMATTIPPTAWLQPNRYAKLLEDNKMSFALVFSLLLANVVMYIFKRRVFVQQSKLPDQAMAMKEGFESVSEVHKLERKNKKAKTTEDLVDSVVVIAPAVYEDLWEEATITTDLVTATNDTVKRRSDSPTTITADISEPVSETHRPDRKNGKGKATTAGLVDPVPDPTVCENLRAVAITPMNLDSPTPTMSRSESAREARRPDRKKKGKSKPITVDPVAVANPTICEGLGTKTNAKRSPTMITTDRSESVSEIHDHQPDRKNKKGKGKATTVDIASPTACEGLGAIVTTTTDPDSPTAATADKHEPVGEAQGESKAIIVDPVTVTDPTVYVYEAQGVNVATLIDLDSPSAALVGRSESVSETQGTGKATTMDLVDSVVVADPTVYEDPETKATTAMDSVTGLDYISGD